MKRVLAVMAMMMVACGGGDDGDDTPPFLECGPTPGLCDGVFENQEACPRLEDLCRPDTCGSYECCWCGRSNEGLPEWKVIYNDCFEGCPGFVDAGVDAVDAAEEVDAAP